MPPKGMMVIGYEEDGTPVLAPEINAPATAPADPSEEPSPEFEPLLGMMDFEAGMQDMSGARADTPEAVAADAASMPSTEVRRAEPVVPTKGVHWDLQPIKQIASLYAAGNTEEADRMRDQYRSASPVNAYVYDNLRGKSRVTALYAAGLADSYRQIQDRITMQQAGKDADPAKQREQAQQAARVQSVLGIMDKYTAEDSDLDKLVGPAAGSFVANEYDKWQNPDRYAKRFELSFTTKTEVLEAAKYVKPLSNDERKFLEEMFPRRDDPPQVWREYFKRTREILSQGLPQQPQAQGAAPAAAAPQPSQPPPNLKPTRIDPVTGQPMTLIQNQQGKWVYRLAPQQPQQSNASGR
jgi:hypothetical protein